ncbi:MAG: prenyltransferase [Elusimicrobia bacterium]|nr:prenyltransferase [Elusimicrobiota bacterium]
MNLLGAVRYRFFLYAGLLPYLLGAAWAYGMEKSFAPGVFWLGLLGIVFAVVGVEAFNEYFDSRLGTDRVFNPDDADPVLGWALRLGAAAFAAAAAIGLALAWNRGWPILLYMTLGGLAAVFYVGPPIRWAYRGLGEAMIALSYGPWMTLGSLHLQTGRFSSGALLASLVPAFLIGALAVVNEIPDYHQDRLVGKRNLVVRLGRQGGVILYLAMASLGLAVPVLGALAGLFPARALLALAALPLLGLSAKAALGSYEEPRRFVPAVRYAVLAYVVATGCLAIGVRSGQ